MDAKLFPEVQLPTRHAARGAPSAPGAFHAARMVRGDVQARAYISDSQPAGRYIAKDVFEGDDVPLLPRILLDHGFLHGECLTVRGRTVADNLWQVMWNEDQFLVRPAGKPLAATSGAVGLRGNLAPKGVPGKVAGMAGLQFTGPARCFDGEEARFGAVNNKNYREGEVLVIRQVGSRGGPGMREILSPIATPYAAGEVGLACLGAATHFGGTAEKTCYADL